MDALAGVTLTADGTGLTVIVAWAVPVHPLPSVPVTVYTIVEAGDATTEAPVAALNPVAGNQL
jgi:hypothetical protein